MAIGEAQAFGGALKGALVLSKEGEDANIKSQLQFADVDLEACLGELFGLRRLEGRGNLNFSVEATGDSVLALTRTLAGTASLTATPGRHHGLQCRAIAQAAGAAPALDRRRFPPRTHAVRAARHRAAHRRRAPRSVEDVKLEGGAIRLAVGGSASIPMRDLDLKGTAALVSATSESAPFFELPFVVQGRWDDPIMLPDAQSLIRRSGAAAPLLDAVRDRKTRDAVRTVVDKLNRDGARRRPRPPPRRLERPKRCYHRQSDESGAGTIRRRNGCLRAFSQRWSRSRWPR